MNHQHLRSWPPPPGRYRAGREGRLDAVAVASLRSAVGPLHLRLPVTEATLVIKRKLTASSLTVDIDSSAVRSSAPLPVRHSVDARLARALDAVRLETSAVEEVADGRLRGYADLYAGGGVSQVRLEVSVLEIATAGLRVAVRARVPRSALGLDSIGRAGQLAGPWVRLVIALHATIDAERPRARQSRALTGAVA